MKTVSCCRKLSNERVHPSKTQTPKGTTPQTWQSFSLPCKSLSLLSLYWPWPTWDAFLSFANRGSWIKWLESSDTGRQCPGGELDRNELGDILGFWWLWVFEQGGKNKQKTGVFSFSNWGIFLWIQSSTFGVQEGCWGGTDCCSITVPLHNLQYLSSCIAI